MKQLTLGEILMFANQLKKSGMTDREIVTLPIYIGDDDELNGIHCAWEASIIDANDKSESGQYILEMINERSANYKLTDKAILIS